MDYQSIQTELLKRLAGRAVSALDTLNSLLSRSGEDPEIHAKLVASLLGTTVDEDEARAILTDIIEHHAELSARMDREVDFRVAAMDYATSHPNIVRQPVIVDQHVLTLSQRLAAVDELTGLFNRRFLNIYLSKEVNRAQRYDYPFTIVFLDLDNFKTINDSYGHEVGDEVLAGIAHQILDLLRKEDFAARYGGEEFVVVLPHTDIRGAIAFSDRLAERLAQMRFPHGVAVTCSGGIAAFPEHGIIAHDLLHNADTALYQAKLNGKAHVRVATTDKRTSPRRVADLAARCYVEDHELGEVRLRDISRAGLSVAADTLLTPGQVVRFCIRPPSEAMAKAKADESVEVFAQVVWSRQIGDLEYRSGGRWTAEDDERIRTILEQIDEG
ncbi:MAG: diguanylate cyclase [Spirochaetota bacterium]